MSSPSTWTESAYILRSVPYRDSDLILTLIGRESGPFSARVPHGRASRKRFGGALGLFQHLRVVVQRKGKQTFLTESSVEVDHFLIEQSYEKIIFASYATDILRSLAPYEGHFPTLFTSIDTYYNTLNTAPVDLHLLEIQLNRLILEFLTWSGALPAILTCHRCGLPHDQMEKHRFLRSGEGLVCTQCLRGGDQAGVLLPDAFSLLRFLIGDVPPQPTQLANPDALSQVRRLVRASLLPNLLHNLPSYAPWLQLVEPTVSS